MTIAITGGTGFLGSRVVAELLARGHHVRCLIRSTRRGDDLARSLAPELRARLELCPGSLDRADDCRGLLRHCDTVVHVAAPLTGSVPSLFATGVIPTRRLVDAAIDSGVRRFVLISSLAVYGSQDLAVGSLLDEDCDIDHQPHRRDPYTYSKIAQEDVCWQAHHHRNLPLVVIRPGILFGPGRPLLTPRIGLMVGGVLVRMDGRQQVPYCFVDNCAHAIALAAVAPNLTGACFNIVDDNLPVANDVLRWHRRHVSNIRTIRIPRWAVGRFARACAWYAARSQGMFPPVLTPYKAAAIWKRLRYSNARAKARLGWEPRVRFAEAVQRTVQRTERTVQQEAVDA
jgi:nucleoside-diphosphate-sugar epimerase